MRHEESEYGIQTRLFESDNEPLQRRPIMLSNFSPRAEIVEIFESRFEGFSYLFLDASLATRCHCLVEDNLVEKIKICKSSW